ncbi:MAG TPA: glycosyltransferase [Devosia sp.]|nr:glycosyltransferase [Devosia sp.]
MNAPRFTVLMPTHYRPDVIGFAIRSVLAQTDPDFELLVVGDGAIAGTAEIVFGFGDPRIRWFDLPKGPAFGYANRNIALRESRGELMAYAADDDLMFPDHLERLGAAFADSSVQWAYAPAFWVSSDGIAGPDLTNLELADERDYFTRTTNTIVGGSTVYRAEAFPSRAAFPEHVQQAADWHMMKTLLAAHGPGAMRRLDEPTLMHFVAGRKTRRDSRFDLLAGYLDIADRVDWWPRALHPAIPPGATPQSVYADILATPGGSAQLRAAARLVVSRAALDWLSPRVMPSAGANRHWRRSGLAMLSPLKNMARRAYHALRR